MNGPPEVVLAMAGHVDHGKSALAEALTGQRTDRRDVERTRGLTVDLGHLVLAGGGQRVALTDVPGHIDYLANTVVGLAGATDALLVVAADDGWMPQTEDHVRAARHLRVPVPLVAVTKSDLVDRDRVEEVLADVGVRLEAEAPTVVPVSASTGDGVDRVRDVLTALPAPEPGAGAPRVWIDRAFHVEGRGLVVTGTLRHGTLAVGDRVTVAPAGRVGRVRAVQQHGTAVDRVTAPGRVALDLVDVVADRGDRLLDGRLGRAAPRTDAVDAWVDGGHQPGIGERGAWILHVGATSVEVRVAPLSGDPVAAGEGAPVHLRLARPLPLVHGDRFVLRDVGRRVVAGGGVVLDPRPPGRARGRGPRRARADALVAVRQADDPVGALVRADGGATPRDRLVTALADPDAGTDTAVDDHVVDPSWREALLADVRERLTTAGEAGLPLEALVADLASARTVPNAVVRTLLDTADEVDRRDTRLVLPTQRPGLDAARQRALRRLHAALRAAPLAPDPFEDLLAAAGVAPADADRLVRDGAVLRSGPYAFLPGAVEAVVGRLRDLEAGAGPFTVAQVRDALGITRRHAVPWVELLDRLGVTIREGDRRRVSPSAGSSPRAPRRTGR